MRFPPSLEDTEEDAREELSPTERAQKARGIAGAGLYAGFSVTDDSLQPARVKF